MKIVNIFGGLGNQMFHYAFALSLKYRFPEEEIRIDISHMNYIFLKKFKTANLHNGYELDSIFPNLSIQVASARQLLLVTWYIPNFIISRLLRKLLPKRNTEYIQKKDLYFAFDKNAYQLDGNVYYEGYWESISFYEPIRDIIMSEFSFPSPNQKNEILAREIKLSQSVGIHVRRGDYLEASEFKGLCGIDYYKRAIGKIIANGKQYSFYIFSNDINWCIENLSPLLKNYSVSFITHNVGIDSYWDMYLMTFCKNLIIANSTFSWWGAFLNKMNANVYAPQQWMNRDVVFDIYLKDWILI